jgi:hypothetical protein
MKKNVMSKTFNLHEYVDVDSIQPFIDSGLVFKTDENKYGDFLYGMKLPSTPDWCDSCEGGGGRSKYDVEGYDIDKMLEDDEDGQFRDSYFGGETDVCCDVCNGKGFNTIFDFTKATDEQQKVIDLHFEIVKDERADRAYADQERRCGA